MTGPTPPTPYAQGRRNHMVGRRGEYGLDGTYPRLGLLVQASLEAALMAVALRAARHGSPWLAASGAVGAGAVAAITGGSLYATRRGKFEVWKQVLDELSLRPGDHILDIGCGRGAVLLLAAAYVPSGHAVGVDIWRRKDQLGNSRDAAERNAEVEGVADRVELVHGDARDLPFDQESFDVVVSNLAIHNITGIDGRNRALREAVRVLRPNGQLCIVDFFADRYVEALRAAGCRDATVRRLSWRINFGLPINVVRLVRACK